ncbi:MAG: M15 family metallopeptidase [Prevotella sp.]|uniref:M15 family metallopeptidase n=1 Tax=Prevotella sp. TaxID=59823 RepID=UPI002A306903|nr:M15 family metallopeptidase [Prevotella sp.]MDD7318867.1 M15 family metallopeptidase [Prevotellaceae bacterium]MDY4019245.1 M15 family metallopeptidase [Prevotella sp.]
MKIKTYLPFIMFFTTILMTTYTAESWADKPRVKIIHDWKPGMVVSEFDVMQAGIERCFMILDIDAEVWSRINGTSWRVGCPVKRTDLCYLRLLHRNKNGDIQTGEMVVNRSIAERVIGIFKELYLQKYRIESIFLIDNYGGDDDKSMAANNTSCFNYRNVEGTKKLSRHAYGLAIDINPRYNPYVRGRKVSPQNGAKYAFNREKRSDIPYKIDCNDLAFKLFKKAGAVWGGDWKTMKDYQHFQFSMP